MRVLTLYQWISGQTIVDEQGKSISIHGGALKTFQATNAQRADNSIYGMNNNVQLISKPAITGGIARDSVSVGLSRFGNYSSQKLVDRTNQGIIEGISNSSKGVVPVHPELYVVGPGGLVNIGKTGVVKTGETIAIKDGSKSTAETVLTNIKLVS